MTARREVDIRSQEWEVCLHEIGHAVVARALGWHSHRVEVRRTWLGDWEGHYRGDPPRGLATDKETLQLAAVALGGPEVSRRRSWLFLPSGCSWDLATARDLVAGTRVRYRQAETLARRLVAARWNEIEREARRLYLTGNGRWTA